VGHWTVCSMNWTLAGVASHLLGVLGLGLDTAGPTILAFFAFLKAWQLIPSASKKHGRVDSANHGSHSHGRR
jgi:hypothetical protein